MVWKEKSSKFIFIHVFIFGNDGGKVDVGSSGTWDIDLPCAQFPRVIRGNEPGCKASGNNDGILTVAIDSYCKERVQEGCFWIECNNQLGL